MKNPIEVFSKTKFARKVLKLYSYEEVRQAKNDGFRDGVEMALLEIKICGEEGIKDLEAMVKKWKEKDN